MYRDRLVYLYQVHISVRLKIAHRFGRGFFDLIFSIRGREEECKHRAVCGASMETFGRGPFQGRRFRHCVPAAHCFGKKLPRKNHPRGCDRAVCCLLCAVLSGLLYGSTPRANLRTDDRCRTRSVELTADV